MKPVADPYPVLISAAGRRVALLEIFRSTLRTLGLPPRVLAADMSRLSAAFHAADRAYRVPRCDHPSFVATLLDICERHAVAVLVPTNDHELPIYAAHREQFAAIGTTVAISAPAVIEIGRYKDQTFRFLKENGFPTVATARPSAVFEKPGDWPFPLLVKPRAGSASIGVRVVQDADELVRATGNGDFLVQQLASGSEHTIDILADRQGHCRCAVPRKRLEVRAGEVSKAMTVRQPQLMELAERVCEALPGAYGTLNLQVFYDEQSRTCRIIELNPRFGGGFPLAWQAGADYPRWLLEEILGLPTIKKFDGWQAGLVMLRYDAAVFATAADVK